MLLKLAGDEFLVHCRVAKNLSAHSLRAYAIDLAEFQQFFGGDRKVGEVDRNSLRAYLVPREEPALKHFRRVFLCLARS